MQTQKAALANSVQIFKEEIIIILKRRKEYLANHSMRLHFPDNQSQRDDKKTIEIHPS